MTYSESERKVLARARAIKAKKRNAAKKARPVNPKADRGRVRDPGFLAFLRRQPCSVRQAHGIGCDGPIQAAHIRTHKPGELPTGLQRKPDDRRATSLCAKHHAEQHGVNELWFWHKYSLDPFEIAERLYAEYQRVSP